MKKGYINLLSIIMVVMILVTMSIGSASAKTAKKPVLNCKTITLYVKGSKKLTVKKIGKNKIKKITFKSSNKKVAKVSKKGKVTAKKVGTVKITCKVKLKNGKKYTLKCKVKVKKKSTKKTSKPSVSPGNTVSPKPDGVVATPVPVVTATPRPTPKPADPPAEKHLSNNGIETVDNGKMRSDMTAFDIQHAMGVGINLGNTMESCGTWINASSVSNFEKAWGAPITTQEMITGMKEAGFNSIRIPVAWSNMMSTDGSYTISQDYFDRVETIMNYAFNERMYVIINIHYDSGWWARFGSKDATERVEAMNKYKAMWTQISERYIEYSDYLIFESANEELGSRLNSTSDYAGSGYYTTEKELYELTNQINQTFVDIVRGTGGNNAARHLLIAGYDTDIGKTCSSDFMMPTDTVDDHLMVSVHYYSPSIYCLAETEDNSWGYAGSWGTSEEILAMRSDLQNMKINFVNKGYPVVIGEYGVCNTTLSSGESKRKEGRDLFFKTICEYALYNGMCPMLWDITSAASVYDRSTCKMTNEVEAANYLVLSEKVIQIPTFWPSEDNGAYVWSGTIGCQGWNPTQPVAGDDCTFSMTSLGGCYQIIGIDWSSLKNPTLTLHADNLSGSTPYSISLEINTDNEYYNYIQNEKKTGTWSFASDKLIDLTDLNLTGKENLYIALRGALNFSGSVKFTIAEKK